MPSGVQLLAHQHAEPRPGPVLDLPGLPRGPPSAPRAQRDLGMVPEADHPGRALNRPAAPALRSALVRLDSGGGRCHGSIVHARAEYLEDVRGDRVEIVIDAGGEVRTYDIVATRNGRRVDIETARGVVTVTEVTRSGTPVRTARFMASRILALVEHPAADQNIAREVIEPDQVVNKAL